MALPTTGITTSMVASAIGAATNDVGSLFLHENVNEWGFNCPNTGIQNVIWGADKTFREMLSPSSLNYQQFAGYPPGYHLGNFRGYDHAWKTYQFDTLVKTSGDEYYDLMVFTLTIQPAAAKLATLPDPAGLNFTVKIEFKRNSVPTVWTDMGNVTVSAATKSGTFSIAATNPPDFATNGALAQSEGFQLRATIVTPAERRWYSGDYPALLLSVTTPTSLYTNAKYVAGEGGYVVEQTTPLVMKAAVLYGDVYADLPNNGSAVISGYISDTSSFTNKYYPASNANVNIPKSTTPGSAQYAGHFELDFSATDIFSVVGVGSTVYCRLFMDGVQVSGFTVTVTDTPPEM